MTFNITEHDIINKSKRMTKDIHLQSYFKHKRTHTHRHMHTRTHAHIYTRIRTDKETYIPLHTHTRIQHNNKKITLPVDHI